MRLLISCLVLWVGQWQTMLAQDTECQLFYGKVAEKAIQTSNGMRVIDYGVKLVEKGSEVKAQENRVKLYNSPFHRYVITDQVQVYIDSLYSIMLVPSAKSIMISDTDPKSKKSLRGPVGGLLDSLFKIEVTVISCRDVTGKEFYDKEITVKPKDSRTGFSKINYWIKKDNLSIYKIMVTYSKGEYERIEYTFYEDKKDQPSEKMDKPVMDLFLKKDATLLPNYKGYSLTDNRIVSSKN